MATLTLGGAPRVSDSKRQEDGREGAETAGPITYFLRQPKQLSLPAPSDQLNGNGARVPLH